MWAKIVGREDAHNNAQLSAPESTLYIYSLMRSCIPFNRQFSERNMRLLLELPSFWFGTHWHTRKAKYPLTFIHTHSMMAIITISIDPFVIWVIMCNTIMNIRTSTRSIAWVPPRTVYYRIHRPPECVIVFCNYKQNTKFLWFTKWTKSEKTAARVSCLDLWATVGYLILHFYYIQWSRYKWH